MILRQKIVTRYKDWFTENKNNKISINSRAIYKDLSSQIVQRLNHNLSVTEILNWLRNKTVEAFLKKFNKNPELGALNKLIGDWNEFIATSLLSEIVLEMNRNSPKFIAVFTLPNSRLQKDESDKVSSKFISLFSQDEFDSAKGLAKISPFRNKIFLPSPDYIIVVLSHGDIATSIYPLLEEQVRTPDSLALYNYFKGKLRGEDLKAVASLKTSNRPDRRYQPLFEAATIKAMGYALQQNWRYYMVVSELTTADITIFNTAIAPHGIALEQDFKLVDGTYKYNKKDDLVSLVEAAIHE
ncbi:MAG TPA: deoxyribose-phosphate aldolase [Cyanobacteria bacterium UBA11149]|nr:deoxyribose-phosphate aldolase [Cyanobacteria bacterium UBA11367]HBE60299.1 deoxyribose-phosphate aldolase [Cyanobacteria bacterium UBA11366]HBK64004.1 deoxyribose-phosphate aldolase [Cyanobacteria bacterium UBA11166]HBR73517.1 deoxyribose-phosphate aldolase [Cyanobacteria bacterium UBA11159]HBS72077.1 deoxyribose-phosphate aldolase [Cyanobacteria bacterium UBA11153]HBW88321.1 deoxyribose-phosphate aldolase [Cyanobacteria bacterium UBA11149]HCA97310.1 deoxyribose-phosphate aldolase [Cyanob